MDCIKIRDLKYSYAHQPVLEVDQLTFPKGQISAILGPNGSGKSTLIKCTIDVLKHRGKVELSSNNIAYIPQREQVDWSFPITVKDLVKQGRFKELGVFNRFKKQDWDAVNSALNELGLVELQERQISELSGGQQQRAFLARAIAQQADIYLLDEPFVGVDAITEQAIFKTLQHLKSAGKSIIIVHHDLASVSNYFDYVVMLNHTLLAAGRTEDVFTEKNIETLYGGRMNIFNHVGNSK